MLIGIGMGIGGRAGAGGGAGGTLEPVTAGGANGTTASITGVLAGDLILGVVLKTSSTAPTHDVAGGALINSWSSGSSSAIAFWKYAESTTPAFGTHANGSRCLWAAYRFSAPPANPIGASDRISGSSSTTLSWCGLTLTRPGGHVFTVAYRAVDDPIVDRPGAVAAGAATGVSARYKPMRSNGAVTSWAQENVTQTVAGVYQSIAIEIGY
jgi:hypothetical protein